MSSAFTFYFPSILPLRIYSETEKKMIDDFIQSRINKPQVPQVQEEKVNNQVENVKQNHSVVEIKINKYDIGKVIGKGGSTIETIRKETKAQIKIMNKTFGNKRIIRITGYENDIAIVKDKINFYLNQKE